jgi:hypothetical protein
VRVTLGARRTHDPFAVLLAIGSKKSHTEKLRTKK